MGQRSTIRGASEEAFMSGPPVTAESEGRRPLPARPLPKIRWNHGAIQEVVPLTIGIHRSIMQLRGKARDMSSQEDKGDGGPFIWLGLALFAPVTLFHLYAQGALALTPISIVGLVLLAIGLVKRNRAFRNEPIAPNDHADAGEQPRSQPPAPPSADD